MFKVESYIAPYLLGYLNKYVKLREEDFQVSLWSGSVEFNNLELQYGVLEDILPSSVHFQSGCVRLLCLQVPWTRLGSDSIVITLNTVECILGIRRPVSSSRAASPSVADLKPTTHPRPNAVTSPNEATTTTSGGPDNTADPTAPSGSSPPSYLQGYMNRILNNIRVVVNNVVLKFAEDDMVLSMNMKSLELHSCDVNWIPSFVENVGADLVLRKVLSASSITVCLDQMSPNGQIHTYDEPLLYRCGIACRIEMRQITAMSRQLKSMSIHLLCNDLLMTLTQRQLPMLSRLMDLFQCLYYGNLDFDKVCGAALLSSVQPTVPVKTSNSQEAGGGGGVAKTMENFDSPESLQQQQSWSSWAWSYVPTVWNAANEEAANQQALKQTKLVVDLAVLLESITVVFKVSSDSGSSGREAAYRYTPLLKLQLCGCSMRMLMKGLQYFSMQVGVSQAFLSPQSACACGFNSSPKHRWEVEGILSVGEKFKSSSLLNYKTQSLFDISGVSVDALDEIPANREAYLLQWSDTVILQRYGAFWMDYYYTMDIVRDDVNEFKLHGKYLADVDGIREVSMKRFIVGNSSVNVTPSAVHRLQTILCFLHNKNGSYRKQRSENPSTDRSHPTEEQLARLHEYIPIRETHLMIMNMAVKFQIFSHQGHSWYPWLLCSCDRVILRFTEPMYSSEFVQRVSRLAPPQEKFLTHSYAVRQASMKQLQLALCCQYTDDQMLQFPLLQIPGDIKLHYDSLLWPALWSNNHLPTLRVSVAVPVITSSFSQSQMIIVIMIGRSWWTHALSNNFDALLQRLISDSLPAAGTAKGLKQVSSHHTAVHSHVSQNALKIHLSGGVRFHFISSPAIALSMQLKVVQPIHCYLYHSSHADKQHNVTPVLQSVLMTAAADLTKTETATYNAPNSNKEQALIILQIPRSFAPLSGPFVMHVSLQPLVGLLSDDLFDWLAYANALHDFCALSTAAAAVEIKQNYKKSTKSSDYCVNAPPPPLHIPHYSSFSDTTTTTTQPCAVSSIIASSGGRQQQCDLAWYQLKRALSTHLPALRCLSVFVELHGTSLYVPSPSVRRTSYRFADNSTQWRKSLHDALQLLCDDHLFCVRLPTVVLMNRCFSKSSGPTATTTAAASQLPPKLPAARLQLPMRRCLDDLPLQSVRLPWCLKVTELQCHVTTRSAPNVCLLQPISLSCTLALDAQQNDTQLSWCLHLDAGSLHVHANGNTFVYVSKSGVHLTDSVLRVVRACLILHRLWWLCGADNHENDKDNNDDHHHTSIHSNEHQQQQGTVSRSSTRLPLTWSDDKVLKMGSPSSRHSHATSQPLSVKSTTSTKSQLSRVTYGSVEHSSTAAVPPPPQPASSSVLLRQQQSQAQRGSADGKPPSNGTVTAAAVANAIAVKQLSLWMQVTLSAVHFHLTLDREAQKQEAMQLHFSLEDYTMTLDVQEQYMQSYLKLGNACLRKWEPIYNTWLVLLGPMGGCIRPEVVHSATGTATSGSGHDHRSKFKFPQMPSFNSSMPRDDSAGGGGAAGGGVDKHVILICITRSLTEDARQRYAQQSSSGGKPLNTNAVAASAVSSSSALEAKELANAAAAAAVTATTVDFPSTHYLNELMCVTEPFDTILCCDLLLEICLFFRSLHLSTLLTSYSQMSQSSRRLPSTSQQQHHLQEWFTGTGASSSTSSQQQRALLPAAGRSSPAAAAAPLLYSSNLPLLYIDIRSVRLFLTQSSQLLNMEEDIFCATITHFTVVPYAENPLTRVVVAADLYEQAVSTGSAGMLGSCVEDRQYSLEMAGFRLTMGKSSELIHTQRIVVSSSSVKQMQHPATMWNDHPELLNRPEPTLHDLLSEARCKLIFAPPIYYHNARKLQAKLVCGYSMEVHVENSINLQMTSEIGSGLANLCTMILQSAVALFVDASQNSGRNNHAHKSVAATASGTSPTMPSTEAPFSSSTSSTASSTYSVNDLLSMLSEPFYCYLTWHSVDLSFSRPGLSVSTRLYQPYILLRGNNVSPKLEFSVHDFRVFVTDTQQKQLEQHCDIVSCGPGVPDPKTGFRPSFCKISVEVSTPAAAAATTTTTPPGGQQDKKENFPPESLQLHANFDLPIVCHIDLQTANVLKDLLLHYYVDIFSQLLTSLSAVFPSQSTTTVSDTTDAVASKNLTRAMYSLLELVEHYHIHWHSIVLQLEAHKTVATTKTFKDVPTHKKTSTAAVLKKKKQQRQQLAITLAELHFQAHRFASSVSSDLCASHSVHGDATCNYLSASCHSDDKVYHLLSPTAIGCHFTAFIPRRQQDACCCFTSVRFQPQIYHVSREVVQHLTAMLQEWQAFLHDCVVPTIVTTYSSVPCWPAASNAKEEKAKKQKVARGGGGGVVTIQPLQRQVYQDDLRRSPQFRFMKRTKVGKGFRRSRISGNTIQFYIDTDGRSCMLWCYAQPRSICRLHLTPVPFTYVAIADDFNGQLQTPCCLQYWSEEWEEFVTVANFYLSENSGADVQVFNDNIVAFIWQIIVDSAAMNEDKKNLSQSSPQEAIPTSSISVVHVSPESLAASLEVDSVFCLSTLPHLSMRHCLASISCHLMENVEELCNLLANNVVIDLHSTQDQQWGGACSGAQLSVHLPRHHVQSMERALMCELMNAPQYSPFVVNWPQRLCRLNLRFENANMLVADWVTHALARLYQIIRQPLLRHTTESSALEFTACQMKNHTAQVIYISEQSTSAPSICQRVEPGQTVAWKWRYPNEPVGSPSSITLASVVFGMERNKTILWSTALSSDNDIWIQKGITHVIDWHGVVPPFSLLLQSSSSGGSNHCLHLRGHVAFVNYLPVDVHVELHCLLPEKEQKKPQQQLQLTVEQHNSTAEQLWPLAMLVENFPPSSVQIAFTVPHSQSTYSLNMTRTTTTTTTTGESSKNPKTSPKPSADDAAAAGANFALISLHTVGGKAFWAICHWKWLTFGSVHGLQVELSPMFVVENYMPTPVTIYLKATTPTVPSSSIVVPGRGQRYYDCQLNVSPDVNVSIGLQDQSAVLFSPTDFNWSFIHNELVQRFVKKQQTPNLLSNGTAASSPTTWLEALLKEEADSVATYPHSVQHIGQIHSSSLLLSIVPWLLIVNDSHMTLFMQTSDSVYCLEHNDLCVPPHLQDCIRIGTLCSSTCNVQSWSVNLHLLLNDNDDSAMQNAKTNMENHSADDIWLIPDTPAEIVFIPSHSCAQHAPVIYCLRVRLIHQKNALLCLCIDSAVHVVNQCHDNVQCVCYAVPVGHQHPMLPPTNAMFQLAREEDQSLSQVVIATTANRTTLPSISDFFLCLVMRSSGSLPSDESLWSHPLIMQQISTKRNANKTKFLRRRYVDDVTTQKHDNYAYKLCKYFTMPVQVDPFTDSSSSISTSSYVCHHVECNKALYFTVESRFVSYAVLCRSEVSAGHEIYLGTSCHGDDDTTVLEQCANCCFQASSTHRELHKSASPSSTGKSKLLVSTPLLPPPRVLPNSCVLFHPVAMHYTQGVDTSLENSQLLLRIGLKKKGIIVWSHGLQVFVSQDAATITTDTVVVHSNIVVQLRHTQQHITHVLLRELEASSSNALPPPMMEPTTATLVASTFSWIVELDISFNHLQCTLLDPVSFTPSAQHYGVKSVPCLCGTIQSARLTLSIQQESSMVSANVEIGHCQVDNCHYDTLFPQFPVCLMTTNTTTIPETNSAQQHETPTTTTTSAIVLQLTLYHSSIQSIHLKTTSRIQLWLDDLLLRHFLKCLPSLLPSNLLTSLSSSLEEDASHQCPHPPPPPSALLFCVLSNAPVDLQHVCIERVQLSLTLRMSQPVYVSVSDSPLTFSEYNIGPALLRTGLANHMQGIVKHFFYGALFKAGWMVSSLELLGNPQGLVRHVASGLSDLVRLPYYAVVQRGPSGLLPGLSRGMHSLVRESLRGILTSVSSASGSLARNVDNVTGHVPRDTHVASTVWGGVYQGCTEFGLACLEAIAGLANEPIVDYLNQNSSSSSSSSSSAGIALHVATVGVGRGLMTLFLRPISGAAQLISRTGQGLLYGSGIDEWPHQQLALFESSWTSAPPTPLQCILTLPIMGGWQQSSSSGTSVEPWPAMHCPLVYCVLGHQQQQQQLLPRLQPCALFVLHGCVLLTALDSDVVVGYVPLEKQAHKWVVDDVCWQHYADVPRQALHMTLVGLVPSPEGTTVSDFSRVEEFLSSTTLEMTGSTTDNMHIAEMDSRHFEEVVNISPSPSPPPPPPCQLAAHPLLSFFMEPSEGKRLLKLTDSL